MRPEGSAVVLEARRRLAIRMLKAGQPQGVVAKLLDVHRGTLWRWRRAVEQGGATAVSARPHPGARPRLSLEQRAQLAELLTQDPTEHGWPTSLWTGRRVAELIRRQFAVRYHPVYVLRLLRTMGLSPQKPQLYARERDEVAIAHWRRYRWPALKKKPAGSAVGRCF
jgi:transposase